MGVVAEDREAAVLLTETNVRSHSMLGLPDCIFSIMTADAASTYFYLCFYVMRTKGGAGVRTTFWSVQGEGPVSFLKGLG